MSVLKVILVIGSVGFGAGLGAASSPDSGAVTASTWFKCTTGATLEINGVDSRCVFPMGISTRPMNGCDSLSGWTATIDVGGNTDACVKDKTVVPRTCPDRSFKVVVVGADRCEVRTVRSPQPPNVSVEA